MPRTKATNKNGPNFYGVDEKSVLDEYKIQVNQSLKRVKQLAEIAIARLEEKQAVILASLSEADLKKTVKQYRSEGYSLHSLLAPLSQSTNSNILSSIQKDDEGGRVAGSGSGDRGCAQAGPKKRPSRRMSRSLSRSNVKKSSHNSGTMPPPSTAYRAGGRRGRRSSSTSALQRPYQTPCSNRMRNFPPITPKVAPNTPMTVLRRPRQGEMVMSLSGSPLLLVSASGVDEMANCNIPLSDGTVLSLVPRALRRSQVTPAARYLGHDTYQQLATLRKNLDIVCQMRPK